MNIKEAKQEIKNTVKAYLQKDSFGEYIMPALRQRPILLIGAPGIGKTQIMEQIAGECDIALVSYTITHHTRQSAVGLPMINEDTFDGQTYSVTEYTMSEIIASMYREMRRTGKKEGILFIDEINCVSETLAPAMLQFLQCKTFGNQAVPQGWIIVAAGNPPEYNKSVREFDMVTQDRVRRIDVEAEYSVWREYARERNLHGAILSYLEIHPKDFYRAENDVDGLQFVTARGWEDLSHLLKSYQALHIPVTEEILYEYLRHHDVAEELSAYLDLYEKYEEEYQISQILAGDVPSVIYERLTRAAFDERATVVELVLDALLQKMHSFVEEKELTDMWYGFLKEYQSLIKNAGTVPAQNTGNPDTGSGSDTDFRECYLSLLNQYQSEFTARERNGHLPAQTVRRNKRLTACLKKNIPDTGLTAKESFAAAKTGFDDQKDHLSATKEQTAGALEHAFSFMEDAFSQGEEMILFVTELTVAGDSVRFLAEYPCEKYLQYSKELLIGSRRRELLTELER